MRRERRGENGAITQVGEKVEDGYRRDWRHSPQQIAAVVLVDPAGAVLASVPPVSLGYYQPAHQRAHAKY